MVVASGRSMSVISIVAHLVPFVGVTPFALMVVEHAPTQ